MNILFLYVFINYVCRYLLCIILSGILNMCSSILLYFEKSVDKYILSKMKKKYISANELRRTIIVKIKYIIKYLTDKIKLILNVVPKKIFNIKAAFRVRIFNVAILYISLLYFNVDLSFLYKYMRKYIYLLNSIQGYLILIVLIPVFRIIYNYMDARLKFYDRRDFLYKEILLLMNGIWKNIEKLEIYNINRKINDVTEEITDHIGFKFFNNKLEKDTKMYLHNNVIKSIDLHLVNTSKIIHKIYDININDNFLLKNLYLNLLEQETKIIDYKSDKIYIENSEYFKKYHNQIYKKIFTNSRVVRVQCLNLLEEHKKSSELWLQAYEIALKEYSINLLILELQVCNYYKRLYEVIFTSNMFDMIKVIILELLKFYLLFIIRILF